MYSVSVTYSGVSNLVRFSSSWRGVDCAGQHRGLGVHVSFVRSLAMDRRTPTQLRRMVSCHLLSSLVIVHSLSWMLVPHRRTISQCRILIWTSARCSNFSPCFHSVWDWGPLGVFRFFSDFSPFTHVPHFSPFSHFLLFLIYFFSSIFSVLSVFCSFLVFVIFVMFLSFLFFLFFFGNKCFFFTFFLIFSSNGTCAATRYTFACTLISTLATSLDLKEKFVSSSDFRLFRLNLFA